MVLSAEVDTAIVPCSHICVIDDALLLHVEQRFKTLKFFSAMKAHGNLCNHE